MAGGKPQKASGMDGKKKKSAGPVKDFKRKTAKVGRKVSRGNVTKIVVATKHIHIPVQSAMEIQAPADERATMDKLYKQLKHYSAPIRLQSLVQLTAVVAASKYGETYISMLVPKALELLFDEDGDTRGALLALMTEVVPKYRSSAFASIISVAVTYLCSGLTSLNAYIRKDTLALLSKFTEAHSTLMRPFVEKLTVNVAALFMEALATIDQQKTEGAEAPKMPKQDSKVHIGSTKKRPDQIAKAKAKAKSGTSKALPDKKIGYLVVVLQVLRSMVRCEAQNSRKGDALTAVNSSFHANGGNTALTFTARINAYAAQGNALGKVTSHAVLEASFYDQVRVLWLDVAQRAKITLSLALVITEVAELILAIATSGADMTACPRFQSLVKVCFEVFPLSNSFHATAFESADDRQVKALLALMDLTLCEAAFALFAPEDELAGGKAVHVLPKVVDFLLQTLASQTTGVVGVSTGMDVDQGAEDMAEVEEPKGRCATRPTGMLRQHHQQELMRRLWRCVEMVLPRCAMQAIAEDVDSQPAAPAAVAAPQQSALWQVVGALRSFISAVQNSSHFTADVAASMARPAILCVCHVCTDESLWTHSFEQSDIFACLVECLLQVPALLLLSCTADADPADSLDHSLSLQFLSALHLFLSRTSPAHACTSLMSQCLLALFQFQKGAGKVTSSFFTRCGKKQRLLLLDIFYVTPFDSIFDASMLVGEHVLISAEGEQEGAAEQRLQEQRHFLSLFLARRTEMAVDDVLDVLFYLLHTVSARSNTKRMAIDAALAHSLACARGAWFGKDVSAAFYAISSSHAPTKIFQYITEELVQLAAKSRDNKPVKHQTGPKADMALWAAEYQNHCCVMECFGSVLNPLFRRLLTQEQSSQTDSAAQSEARVVLGKEDWKAVHDACLALVRTVIAGSAHSPVEVLSESPELQEAERHEPMLLGPYVSCLVVHTPLCVAQDLGQQQESHKYALFSLYLREYGRIWQLTPAADGKRLAMLRGLKRVLEHDLAMGTCIALKEAIVPAVQRCMLDLHVIREADPLAQPTAEVAKLLKSIP